MSRAGPKYPYGVASKPKIRSGDVNKPQRWPGKRPVNQRKGHAMTASDDQETGSDRRGFLKCMLWAGTGVLWTVAGGVPHSRLIGSAAAATTGTRTQLRADQRQPHRLFQSRRTPMSPGTLGEAIAHVRQVAKGNASLADPYRRCQPAIECRRSSTPPNRSSRAPAWRRITCLASTTCSTRTTAATSSSGSPRAPTEGYYSFDQQGVHFVGLNNVQNLKAGGLGNLGPEQLDWLKKDLQGRSEQPADRGVRAHPALDRLPGMGLGHR